MIQYHTISKTILCNCILHLTIKRQFEILCQMIKEPIGFTIIFNYTLYVLESSDYSIYLQMISQQ